MDAADYEITCLVENSLGEDGASPEGLASRHGLSLFVRGLGVGSPCFMLDAGPDASFAANAALLGVRVSDAQFLVLSHGHYDHADGIPEFSRLNPQASIFMQEGACGCFWRQEERYIGIPEEAKTLPSVVRCRGSFRPAPGVFLFTCGAGSHPRPGGNSLLFERTAQAVRPDSFEHEQCVVLERREKGNVLLTGCSHCGILNILDRHREIYGCDPCAVVGGLHLMKRTGLAQKDREDVRAIGVGMLERGIRCFAGHCTGDEAAAVLAGVMGGMFSRVHTGSRFVL